MRPFAALCLASITSYLALVRHLRWKRYRTIHEKYLAKFKSHKLTPREAQEIVYVSTFYDMPLLLRYSLALALFKTYAVPSISKILVSTKEFTCPVKVSKRYIDTQILICTWLAYPLGGKLGDDKDDTNLDPRGSIALARTNWLHSKYKISNDDYLYTLSLFILEPARRAARYGWRPLSEMEQEAFFILWREIGTRMNISDIPDTLAALTEWSLEYERKSMVPAQSNHEVAVGTTEELLYALPEAFGLKNFARSVTACLLEDHVRDAMLIEPPSKLPHIVINSILAFAKFAMKHLLLPRSRPIMIIPQDEVPEESAPSPSPGLYRMRPMRFPSTPWYRPQRTGLGLFLDKLLVSLGVYATLPAPGYHSEGYRLEELGPRKLEKGEYTKYLF
ncbi:hypothetical protein ONZ45_g17963 [Pleurotus djamor]|nr:hypothetical protein ONZ45_g17963 [Pleurotus djamor]